MADSNGNVSTEAHYDASAAALESVTNAAIDSRAENPKHNLHLPATLEQGHQWLAKHIPYKSLESLESNWGLGNYVIDRKTGEKTFEPMSIYVR